MLGSVGWAEILIIILILLLVFGATRIPQLGEALGKGIKNFQKSLKSDQKNKRERRKQIKKHR